MGIIGGSDGPTFIFITSKLDLVLLITRVAAVIGAVVFLVVRRKKKRTK
jgi:Na+-transporting methylmalonyl-CoA/oxaloacetate decarboxylase beta subunit